ncbi:MAG: DNA repair protein RadA [Anaerolineales bacterium]|nr:DNA repair protein RadA [Anaerolineales bacterium]
MTKTRTQYVCQQCGRTTARPLGRCPQCGAWNSMLAEVAPAAARRSPRPASQSTAHRLDEIDVETLERLPIALGEFSRVLGGGIVPGSVVLISGDPGIGKSTLLLQVALALAGGRRVLYVSAEEAERQVKVRALRLLPGGHTPPELYLLAETDLEAILHQIDHLAPDLVIVDSIQAVAVQELEGGAGSITQVRECAARLVAAAKQSGAAVFLVGHVTKEGAIAGPRVLEHMVDTVLYLEGDPFHAYRLLRAVKNRFGATSEVGVFEMRAAGLAEVPNPSEVFLAERAVNAPGSAVAVTIQGARPLLVEVQGLSSASSFGHPRRTANGVDLNRLLLTVAVLQRRLGLHLADQDVFVNVVGGLRVDEPGVDLAVAAALASSERDRAIPADVALIGEIGLSGEVRSVPQLEVRLREANRLGFRRVVVPWSPSGEVQAPPGLNLLPARTLREALAALELTKASPGRSMIDERPRGG